LVFCMPFFKKNWDAEKYSDGQLIVDPPRLNGLRNKQQSFRNLMEPFVWNYILEKDLDEEDNSDEEWRGRFFYWWRWKHTIFALSLQPPHHRPWQQYQWRLLLRWGPPPLTTMICPSYIPIYLTLTPLVRGSGGKMCFFQIAPTPYLSILICSNRYQYDFLKVLLKKNPHNLPVGYVKYWIVPH
jgi:hypothetical protein